MAQKAQDQGSREVSIRNEYSKLCKDNEWNVSDFQCLKAWVKHLETLKLSEAEYAFRLDCAKKEIRFVRSMPDGAPIQTPGPW